MQDSTFLSVVAIICVTVLEVTAIVFLHEDGLLLTGIVAAIAAFSGHRLTVLNNQKET